METVGSFWLAGLSLHVQDTIQFSLLAGKKSFEGSGEHRSVAGAKFVSNEYIVNTESWQFLGKAFVPVMRRSRWDLQAGVMVGLGHVRRPAVRYALKNGKEIVQKEYVIDKFSQKVDGVRETKLGARLDTSLWSIVAGLGARFVYFPVDFVGLYCETDLAWALFHDFDHDPDHEYYVKYGSQHGALTLDLGLGLEVHF